MGLVSAGSISRRGGWTFAEHTTMGVGGTAAHVIVADDDDVLQGAVSRFAAERLVVLGGGSNLLVSDGPYPGTVLCVRTHGLEVLDEHDGRVRIRVAAGEVFDLVVAETVRRGWGGLEALSGIPGRIGATPIQNVGAYGHEIGESLRQVEDIAYGTGARTVRPAADLGLGYRTSDYKRGLDAVVSWVELELTTDGLGLPVRFGALSEALGVPAGGRAPVAEVRREVLRLRRSKGMVYDPADPDTHSCGSFFINPIVADAATIPAEAPRWPAAGGVKLSAAWLIDHAGVHRGFSLPGSRAGISTRHTLAITNRGGASATEVLALAAHIRDRVQGAFGVELAPEPRLIGLALPAA
ncbi:MAG: UDP-N-acetylmuramate dehydrogenase [Pseudoclavibacter sp.]